MKKLISICLAVLLAAGLAGCGAVDPAASLGTLGDTPVTSGLYSLLYYNAYKGAKAAAGGVDNVLKADFDGVAGADYVAGKTLAAAKRFAVVEQMFRELGGALSDVEQSTADQYTDTIWSKNEQVLSENGVDRAAMQLYFENLQKEDALYDLIYTGQTAAYTDEEITDYVAENYYYGLCTYLPLSDSTTGKTLDAAGITQVLGVANTIKSECENGTDMYTSAADHIGQVYDLLGTSYDLDNLSQNVYVDMYKPDTVDSALSADAAKTLRSLSFMQCGVLVNETNIQVFYRYDASDYYTVDEMRDSVTRTINNAKLEEQLTGAEAALANGLSASGIKKFTGRQVTLA